ncbi:hypothetical protein K1719_029737 [Acacia pycnantha]|nr:hypothetical protein K1719_029737 [Acacia pycnantha]
MIPLYMSRFLLFSELLLLFLAGLGNGNHEKCPQSFDCGELGKIHFPFTKAERQDCGLMVIHGCDDPPSSNKTIQLEKNGRPLKLTSIIQQNNSLSVIVTDIDLRKRLKSKTCQVFNKNITLPHASPLVSFHIKHNITLVRCDHSLKISPPANVYNYTCHNYNIYHYHLHKLPLLDHYYQTFFSGCSVLLLPSKHQTHTKDLFSFLTAQMVIEVQLSDACVKCHNNIGDQCRLDSDRNFYCDKEKTGKTVLIATTVASSMGLAVLLLFLAFCYRRKLLSLASSSLSWRKKLRIHQITEASLKQHGPISSRQYSYSEIKKITDCFKIKLGKGGYGTVYKGKLPDDTKRLVAVKVLSQLKCTDEEFINEVASISRTSHVNIVGFLGYCFQGTKRALVYEFMPNGSLEKFIYECQLDCQTLFSIAVGVARGLEYLHRGCNKTKILHLDIKPHNILLDNEFCPKISDFGLAKVLPVKDRIVSILEARGTVGYTAPEVFSRKFGDVSHKSDVFSYGMVVLEMVGGRRNMNVGIDRSSETYVPQWIYKRLELNQELELGCIKNDTDKEMIRKMTMVSLWCVQTEPSMRPEMSKVVEMLEGSLESLEVPPKPFFFSSSTSAVHSTSQTCEIMQL